MCDEDYIELYILLPVKHLGFGMAKRAELTVCTLPDVHYCWKYRVTWARSRCFPLH